MISCNNVCKSIGSFKLKDISFELPEGYIMGIIGRNGCGKTTLIRTLMTLYRIKTGDFGDISINGAVLSEDIKSYKSKIAYVVCDNPFPPSAKVIEIGLVIGRYYKNFDLEKYRRLISSYGIDIKERISHLSAGQQIRVQLAFALSIGAELYIFDEPTGKLDVQFRDSFYKSVRMLAAEGKSVIYVSHLVEELENFADYILWMKREDNESVIKYFGTIDELKNSYQLVEGDEKILSLLPKEYIVGGRKRASHKEILVKADREALPESIKNYARYAELNEIMYYEEKGAMV